MRKMTRGVGRFRPPGSAGRTARSCPVRALAPLAVGTLGAAIAFRPHERRPGPPGHRTAGAVRPRGRRRNRPHARAPGIMPPRPSLRPIARAAAYCCCCHTGRGEGQGRRHPLVARAGLLPGVREVDAAVSSASRDPHLRRSLLQRDGLTRAAADLGVHLSFHHVLLATSGLQVSTLPSPVLSSPALFVS